MVKYKRPKDTNQRAKLLVELLTGETTEKNPDEGKNPAAVALGRLGGKARAARLSVNRRKGIAKKAAKKRWSRAKKK
ncbi:MAG: RNA-binding protein [Bacteroidia bacterium]